MPASYMKMSMPILHLWRKYLKLNPSLFKIPTFSISGPFIQLFYSFGDGMAIRLDLAIEPLIARGSSGFTSSESSASFKQFLAASSFMWTRYSFPTAKPYGKVGV